MKKLFCVLFCILMLSGCLLTAASASRESDMTELIEQLISESGASCSNVSVAIYFPETDEYVYYNADEWYMHASLYKLPLCMLLENLALHGDELAQTVEEKVGLETAVEACMVHSNNNYAKLLLNTYVGKDRLYDYVSSLLSFDEPISDEHRSCAQFTARIMLDVLKELYSAPEEYPNIIEYMKLAQTDRYLRRYQLPEGVEVAQKYGAWDTFNHIAGIIYAEQPVLITVMTRGMGIVPANNLMGSLALAVCQRVQQTPANTN